MSKNDYEERIQKLNADLEKSTSENTDNLKHLEESKTDNEVQITKLTQDIEKLTSESADTLKLLEESKSHANRLESRLKETEDQNQNQDSNLSADAPSLDQGKG